MTSLLCIVGGGAIALVLLVLVLFLVYFVTSAEIDS